MPREDRSRLEAWKTREKVLLVLAAGAGLLAYLPSYLQQDPGLLFALWSAVVLVAGIAGFVWAWRGFRRRRLVRTTPTSEVESLAVGGAEVKGQARPVDGTLVSPLTREEAVLFDLEVEEYHPEADGRNWQTVYTLTERVPFVLDDGTGTVRVEPDDASLDVQREERLYVDGGAPPPDELRWWAVDQGLAEPGEARNPEDMTTTLRDMIAGDVPDPGPEFLVHSTSGRRRYTETVLPAGEEVYVLGGARIREDADRAENPRNLVMREHRGTGTFVVSDRDERELGQVNLVETVFSLAVGLVGIPYGLLGLLRFAGVI